MIMILFVVNCSYAQWTTSGSNISYTSGSVFVGSPSLYSGYKLGVQGQYALGSPDGSGLGGVLTGNHGGFSYFSNKYGDGFFSLGDGEIFVGDYVGDDNLTYIQVDDISGKIFMNSYGGYRFNYGASSCGFGSANGPNLNYGTSYFSFNADRDGFTGNWAVTGDGSHNGGGVMYSSILNGEIYFAPIESTGTASKTLTDLDIKSKIAFKITPTAAYAKQVYVQLTGWPDYVFKKDYKLMPLQEVKSYIDQNHHLPDMPTASDVEKDGLNLGDMNKLLTKKMEELTLYLIEQEKINQSLQIQINNLAKQLKK